MRRAAAVVMSLLVLGACSANEGEDPVRRGTEPTPEAEVDLPDDNRIVFVAGTTLYVTDSGTQSTDVLVNMPSDDVGVSPDGKWFAYSDDKQSPRLFVGKVAKPKVTTVSEGRDPVWSPDGETLAAILPDPTYRICNTSGKKCRPGERVVMYDPKRLDSKPEVAIGAGTWDIVGWSEDVPVAYEAENGGLNYGNPAAESVKDIEAFLVTADDALDVAGEERAVLAGELNQLFYGDPAQLESIQIEGRVQWAKLSPDGTRAVFASEGTDGATAVYLIDLGSREIEPVPNSDDVEGPAVWSPTSESFAFARASGKEIQARICDIDLDCDDLFSSDGRITLLTLDN